MQNTHFNSKIGRKYVTEEAAPKYEIGEIDGAEFRLSDIIQSGNRPHLLVYVKTEGEEKFEPRLFYRSKSSMLWRFLPDFNNDHYCKSDYGENAINAPFELQSAIEGVLLDHPMVEGTSSETLNKLVKDYTVTTSEEGDISSFVHKRVGFENDSLTPRRIDKSQERHDGVLYVEIADPTECQVAEDLSPIFDNYVDSWRVKNDVYGEVTARSFLSQDGSLKYLIFQDSEGRAWVGGVECQNVKVSSLGVKEEFIEPGSLVTPLYEYHIPDMAYQDGRKGGGFWGNPDDCKGSYVGMDKYTNQIPMIREFYKKYGEPKHLQENDDISDSSANDEKERFAHVYKEKSFAEKIDDLIANGTSIDEIMHGLDKFDIEKNLHVLTKHGAKIDMKVFDANNDYDTSFIDDYASIFIDHCNNINELVPMLSPGSLNEYLDKIIAKDANIWDVFDKLRSCDVAENLDTLISHGIDAKEAFDKLDSYEIARNLDVLISHGIDIKEAFSRLDASEIASNLDTLIDCGIEIDINKLISELDRHSIADNLDALVRHGAKIDVAELVSELSNEDIAEYLDALIKYGASINVDKIVDELSDFWLIIYLDNLIRNGAKIDKILDKCDNGTLVNNLDKLIANGVDVNKIVSKLDQKTIINNLDTLLAHGADV
ncbi:hypothetical protein IJI91_00235 [Candidatus Saccharibacteria bacterium]|nr:hypothetical protein [Candidatus Saccharibacteria bacterium]